LQVLKQKVSRALRKRPKKSPSAQLPLPFHRSQSEAPAFWQRRFYDFNVWSGKKLKEKLDYMHRNPVQRKLVVHPKDWPWSSWSHYAKDEPGLIRIDALGSEETNSPKQKRQPPHP
jgi:putative transposase